MNDLEKYFNENTGRLISKWHHYFEVYDRHFSKYRGKEVHILEFGVSQGGSLQMWKNYFGDKCKIYGVDINPNCKMAEEENVKVFIGDQENREFLKSLAEQVPKIDILIDDGGHSMKQQINTFEELFPSIEEDGVYLCEDLHTSYQWDLGGGYKRRGTFIEYSKKFIDFINAWHSKSIRLPVNDFTKSAHSLHYYDSILVIEKRKIEQPYESKTGNAEIAGYKPPKNIFTRVKREFRRTIRRIMDRF